MRFFQRGGAAFVRRLAGADLRAGGHLRPDGRDGCVTEAPSGIIGLETSLALGITSLVKPGHLSMLELLEKMTINPARLYHMPYGTISEGAAADFVIFDPDEKWVPCEYASKSSNTPFTGMELTGKVKYTVCGGNVIYSDK